MNNKLLIVCRGGGDLATGIIHRLTRAGFRVLVLETDMPSAIRRQVSFCQAVYDGECEVEGIKAVRIETIREMQQAFEAGKVPVLIDKYGDAIRILKPDILVDAIIAKKNMGTTIDMAPLVIGVGPGFEAGKDVHLVVETMRGHNLARIYREGSAAANTGIPGNIGGFTKERVIYAPATGRLQQICHIGDVVEQGQEIARIYPPQDEGTQEDGQAVSVIATISGIVRGLIQENYPVKRGLKIADIDPRAEELKNSFTISDKSRSIGGSVLEAVAAYTNSVS